MRRAKGLSFCINMELQAFQLINSLHIFEPTMTIVSRKNHFRIEQRETPMELNGLKQHIRTLAMLNETEAPVVSCYLNLEAGAMSYRTAFEERLRILKKSLTALEWHNFNEAILRIDEYARTSL